MFFRNKYLAFAFVLCAFSSLNAQQSSVAEGITTLGSDTVLCPDILQGDTIEAVFYIHNFGTEPVKIFQVHPGCQCTAPFYHDSLFPGHTDSIILVFYSRKHHDPVFFKDVIVLNNIAEKNYFISGRMKMNPDFILPNKRIRITNKPNKL